MSEQNWSCLDKMSEVNFSPAEALHDSHQIGFESSSEQFPFCNDSQSLSNHSLPFVYLKLANCEDPDEMLHIAAFHQGLHCLLRTISGKYIKEFISIQRDYSNELSIMHIKLTLCNSSIMYKMSSSCVVLFM